MPSVRSPQRLVIAGASSLLGTELKSLLEESRFAGWDVSLVDEDIAAGTLTEAAGEPSVIQAVEESTFSRAQLIFFSGSSDFALKNFQAAHRSGAIIIDLSGHSVGFVNSFPWFHGIERLTGQSFSKQLRLATIPSAGAEAIIRLSLCLKQLGARDLTAVVFQPVSAAGKPGIEELETQTSQLLSFQSPGKQLFDAQVAFNMVDRFGRASHFDLRGQALSTLRNEVYAVLRDNGNPPAIQLLHAPVFYGTAFSICATLDRSADLARIENVCKEAGFGMLKPPETPSNLSVASQTMISLAQPEANRPKEGTWWFWGAADNIRLPAWNAVKLAEKLVVGQFEF